MAARAMALWALALAVSLVHAAALATGYRCEEGQYLLAGAVAGSSSSISGSFSVSLTKFQAKSVVTFPAGTANARVDLSPADPHLKLQLIDDTTKRCVLGHKCLRSDACSGVDACTLEYNGMSITFSAAPQALELRGELNHNMSISVHAEAASRGTLRYSQSVLRACHRPRPACAPCSSYAGCGPLELRVCSGDGAVTCSERRLLRSGVGKHLAWTLPPSCKCCHWPFNAAPLRFGVFANERGFDLKCHMLADAWLNQARGGLCVSGQRRPVELVLFGGDLDSAGSAAGRATSMEDVHVLLARSESGLAYAREAAGQVAAAVLALPSVTSPEPQEMPWTWAEVYRKQHALEGMSGLNEAAADAWLECASVLAVLEHADTTGELPDAAGAEELPDTATLRELGTVCPPGTVCNNCTLEEDGECVECEPGMFSNGSHDCQECPAGRFANRSGMSECLLCDVGQEAARASQACVDCRPGTFAANEGTSMCIKCRPGFAAEDKRSTKCTICPPGTHSNWGAEVCKECPAGNYQELSGKSKCLTSPGAFFEGNGSITGKNKPRHWTKQLKHGLSWEFCLKAPGSCLVDERCGEGSIGRHCDACLPGYAHERVRGMHSCFKCPPLGMNILATLVVAMLNLLLAFWMAQLALSSVRHKRDTRLLLVKAWILHMLAAEVSTHMMGEVAINHLLKQSEEFGDLMHELALSVMYMCTPFRMMPGFSIQSETRVWSVHCLLHGDIAIERDVILKLSTHTGFQNETALQEQLESFHRQASLRLVLFWAFWPLLLCSVAYFLSLIRVLWWLRVHRDFYSEAVQFYAEAREGDGASAVGERTTDAWTAYVRAYDFKIAGIWWPVPHIEAAEGRGAWLDWEVFHRESLPLLLSVVFVTYGGTLVGITATLQCQTYGNEPTQYVQFSNTLMCNSGMPSQLLAAGFLWLWGLGCPAVLWVLLWRATQRATWRSSLVEVSVLLNGYSFHSWFWEIVIFLTKFSIVGVAHLPWTPEVHSEVQLVIVMAYGISFMLFRPYTTSGNRVMERVNEQMVLLWIVQCLLFQFIFMFMNHFPKSGGYFVATIFVAMSLHAVFVVSLFCRIFNQSLDVFLMGVDTTEWLRSLEAPQHRSFLNFMRRKLLALHMRDLSSKPYAGLDTNFCWLTICGNGADEAVVPNIPHGLHVENGRATLSQAPPVPQNCSVKVTKDWQRQSLQQAVSSALACVVETQEGSTISVSLLEFAIRAAFLAGAENDEQRRKLQALHKRLVSAHAPGASRKGEEVAMGSSTLDPVELLGDEETGEDMEKAVGRRISVSKWWVDGPKTMAQRAQHTVQHREQYSGQVEAEEVVLYRAMVDEIAEREKRRNAESSETVDLEQVALRKKVSSVMYKSIFTQVVSTFCESSASSFWKWLKAETLGEPGEGQVLAPHTRVSRLETTGVSKEMRTYYRQKVEEMFNPKFFERGVELGSLMLGLTDMALAPPVEMKLWVDLFEAKWQEHKVIQSASFKTFAGLIKHQSAQTQDMLMDHQEPTWQREVGSVRDPFTTSWLPKLGILQAIGGHQRGTTTRETGAQTDESRLYHYSRGHGSSKGCQNCLNWARLVLAASLPDFKAVGIVTRRRHHRRAAAFERSLEAHRARQQTVLEAQHRVEAQIGALGGQARRSVVRMGSRHLSRQGTLPGFPHDLERRPSKDLVRQPSRRQSHHRQGSALWQAEEPAQSHASGPVNCRASVGDPPGRHSGSSMDGEQPSLARHSSASRRRASSPPMHTPIQSEGADPQARQS